MTEPSSPRPGSPGSLASAGEVRRPAQVFEARIEPGGDRFDAPADLPLLLAAERSGLKVVSSCRNGTCRTCIAQLLSGEVGYRIEWPGLSVEEKKSGCMLPCVAYPLSSVVWTNI